jgi:hypothetical protein
MASVIVTSPEELRVLVLDAVHEAIQATAKPEAWLPVDIVAERLCKTPKTIRNWIKDGRFNRYSGGDGQPYLISSLEIDELIRSAKSAPDAS